MDPLMSKAVEIVKTVLPADKLLDVVCKAVGTLYEPIGARFMADVEAYKMTALAKAEVKVELIKLDGQDEIAKRAGKRLYLQELQRQQNIESVTQKAIDYLPETVSEKEVDADWRTKFFNKVQDISDSDVQDLWAKILAKEVAEPESTSVRLLDILSTISRKEATVFERFCSLASSHSYVYKIKNGSLNEWDIKFSDLLLLRELKLLHESDMLSATIPPLESVGNATTSKRYFNIELGQESYQFLSINPHSNEPAKTEWKIDLYALTTSGEQLCNLLNKEFNNEYGNKWLESQKEGNFTYQKIPDFEVSTSTGTPL